MATIPSQIRRLYEFGPFRLDPQKRLLTKESEPVSLTPKVVETLILLVENRGRVVSKDELMKTLWPDSFVEESNLSQNIFVLRKALGDSQDKRYILTVPGRGYQFTGEVHEVGDHQEEALVVESRSRAEVLVTQTETHSAWVWIGITIISATLFGAGLLSYRARHRDNSVKNSSTPASSVKLRRSVAILDFRNLTHRPDDEWLSTALAEMLRTDLAAGDQLRMVPGDQISQAGHDALPTSSAMLSKESLLRLRTNLETDYVALGDYTVLGEGSQSQVRLDFRLQDTNAGEVIVQDSVRGKESDLFSLILQAGSQMREHLTVARTSTEQEEQVRASLPANPKAARLYAEGLAKLREFEAKIAVDLLGQAVAADSKSAQAHAALGLAWQALGYALKAKDETQKALALSKNLRSEDQLAIEGQYRRFNHEWPRAIEIYKTLTDLYTDNIIYFLQLAQTQQDAGMGKDGIATIQSARKLPPPLGDDPRLDIIEAQTLIDLSEFKQAQAITTTAIEKAKQQHARLVLAQALRSDSSASLWQGENDRARADVAEAKVLFAAAGDLRSSAGAVYMGGRIAYEEGKFEEARKHYAEALVVYRQVGNPQLIGRATEMIGNVDYDEGKLIEGKHEYERALVMYREINSRIDITSALGNLANTADALGDLANAEKMQQEVLSLFREINDQRGAGSTLANLGNVQEEEGKLAEAEKNFQLSLELNRKINYKSGVSYPLVGLADVAYRRDDLKAAHDWAQQGLSLREEIKASNEAEYSRFQLAQITLEQGQTVEAEKLAAEAVHNLEKADVPEISATANAMLAIALLANGKVTEARAAAQRGLTLAAKTPEAPPGFDTLYAAARVDMAEGKLSEAKNKLTSVMAQANKNGYLPYEFDVRLALAEIALKSGPTATAKTQLQSLEKDARNKGFLLIARKAAALNAKSVARLN
jgi:DNA-binding winged helix-turn-helix (wHTH) protein/tetratricopeptide (TPR) repeat protein